MGNGGSRIRPRSGDPAFYGTDKRGERWRSWAGDHNQSEECDLNSTFVRRSWFGRFLGLKPKK
jgi:hypothetical protein